MKKIHLPILAGALLFLTSCGYNAMVSSDEGVKSAWAQVQNQYQRRFDLIPNLVETVKAAGQFEKSTLMAVTEARSKMGGVVNINAEVINNPELMKKYQEAQNSLGSALQRLMVVNENYPQLQSSQSYRDMMSQLEGTENRISVERKRYNDAVQNHNTLVRSFPNNFLASWFNFKTATFFEVSTAEAKEAPKVKF